MVVRRFHRHNFPYRAFEEVLSNACYQSPIEVQVFPDKITVLSYPGPMPPVDGNVLRSQRHILAREYRNRRIGDFLKELHLTEGRGTGFPSIYDSMADNGSPVPVFETDDKTYTLVTLKVHPEYQTETLIDKNPAIGVNVLSVNTIEDLWGGVINETTNGAANGAADQALRVIEKEVHNKVVPILENAVDWVRREDLLTNIGLSNQSYIEGNFWIRCLP